MEVSQIFFNDSGPDLIPTYDMDMIKMRYSNAFEEFKIHRNMD